MKCWRWFRNLITSPTISNDIQTPMPSALVWYWTNRGAYFHNCSVYNFWICFELISYWASGWRSFNCFYLEKFLHNFSVTWVVESFLLEAQTKANFWDQIHALSNGEVVTSFNYCICYSCSLTVPLWFWSMNPEVDWGSKLFQNRIDPWFLCEHDNL